MRPNLCKKVNRALQGQLRAFTHGLAQCSARSGAVSMPAHISARSNCLVWTERLPTSPTAAQAAALRAFERGGVGEKTFREKFSLPQQNKDNIKAARDAGAQKQQAGNAPRGAAQSVCQESRLRSSCFATVKTWHRARTRTDLAAIPASSRIWT